MTGIWGRRAEYSSHGMPIASGCADMLGEQDRKLMIYGAAARFFLRLLQEDCQDKDARNALNLTEFLSDQTQVTSFPRMNWSSMESGAMRVREIPVFSRARSHQ